MPDLERALQIAVKAHAGAKDKAGAPYIFHPIRVMMRCRTDDAKIVALLHDVVEDTDVTFDDLSAEGFSEKVLAALRFVTHFEEDSYDAYVEKIAANPIAVEVKLADLEDNSDIRRLKMMDQNSAERFAKYLRAYRFLTGETSSPKA
jgi:(p)ppGpp synthase/HD superfamily hydrolase